MRDHRPMTQTQRGRGVRRMLSAMLLTAALTGCSESPASPSSSGETGTPTVSSASTPNPSQSVAAEQSPTPAPAARTRPQIVFQHKTNQMPAPPPPAAIAAAAPSAFVDISGAWAGRIDTTNISYTTHLPLTSTFTGWQYLARRPDSPDSEPTIDLKLYKAYEHKTDGRRPFYSPGLTVTFPDENGSTWIAYSSWSGSLNWDGPTVELAPDRRTVSFSASTAVKSDAMAGVDLERISWVTVTGVVTCPEPLPGLP